MSKLNVTQLCTGLLGLTEEELRVVNSEVVALLRHKSKIRDFELSRSFYVGSKVSFMNSKKGQSMTGTVEKVNVKSVRVNTPFGVWNVSPSLLKTEA